MHLIAQHKCMRAHTDSHAWIFHSRDTQFFDFKHLMVQLHNSIHAQNSKETNPKAEEIETVTVLKKQ